MRREYLMLAHPYNPVKHQVRGWFCSEKIDGQRAFWDGGISRGLPKEEVPYANCKKDRFVSQQYASGLWTRNGNIINAPVWWLNTLPPMFLDGELWGRNRSEEGRQELMSCVRTLLPDERWDKVWFHVFDIPSSCIFSAGQVSVMQQKLSFNERTIEWAWERAQKKNVTWIERSADLFTSFKAVYTTLETLKLDSRAVRHKQLQLPALSEDEALDWIDMELQDVIGMGGEGLMLRNPQTMWQPVRSHGLLKVKQPSIATGKVIGYTTGRVTDKGSRLLGMMGALILELDGGQRMELSGFTDAERELDSGGKVWATAFDEADLPLEFSAPAFPRGIIVKFKYRGKTRDGIPQEARYLRESKG